MGLVSAIVGKFKLVKLQIAAYPTEARTKAEAQTLAVQFNPESYSLSYKNTFNRGQGINTQGRRQTYGVSMPQELSLKLVMDTTGVVKSPGTGLLPGSAADLARAVLGVRRGTAYDQVSAFLNLAYKTSGSTHEPAYLTLTWGSMTFDCRLSSLDVRYTLFDRQGTPIRAELDVRFTGDLKDPTGSQSKNSPDLTHFRLVKAGDSLPLLCQEIYGSTEHYLMVARVNRLNSFRSLVPGTSLVFPPLAK